MTEPVEIASLIADDGPVAVVLRQYLMPADGKDSPVYPPTYAPPKNESRPHPYNIDGPFADGTNLCVLDSVPSQANRIEPGLGMLQPPVVPAITIAADGAEVNLLDVGHRIADAVVRMSELAPAIAHAMAEYRRGNAVPLAKIAPTSLVFGAWDSRDTGEKLPRIVQSIVRATNVDVLSRSAQYVPPLNYKELGLIPDGLNDDKLSSEGLLAVPSAGAHGGVRIRGEIRRDASINLVTLRSLRGAGDAAQLKQYVLGLALVALLYPQRFSLRQGCLLVLDPDRVAELSLVYHDGRRVAWSMGYAQAVAFAQHAASAFEVGMDQKIKFDKGKLAAALGDKPARKQKEKKVPAEA